MPESVKWNALCKHIRGMEDGGDQLAHHFWMKYELEGFDL